MKIQYKECKSCHEQVEFFNFGMDKRSHDGMNKRCKSCVKKSRAPSEYQKVCQKSNVDVPYRNF